MIVVGGNAYSTAFLGQPTTNTFTDMAAGPGHGQPTTNTFTDMAAGSEHGEIYSTSRWLRLFVNKSIAAGPHGSESSETFDLTLGVDYVAATRREVGHRGRPPRSATKVGGDGGAFSGKTSLPAMYCCILTCSELRDVIRPKSRSLAWSCRLLTSQSRFSNTVETSGL